MAKLAAGSLLISCALIASACSSDAPDEISGATTEVSTTLTTTAPEETTSTTQAPSTTATTVADIAIRAVPAGEFEAFDLPPGFFLQGHVFGERLVLFGSATAGPGGVFWAVDQPFESAVNILDLAPGDLDPGSINQMIYFEGVYYAFPMWAEPEDNLRPTMYVSDDGIDWRKTKFETITRQASSRLTPTAQSEAGGSGVSRAIVSNGQILATGWASEDDAPVPVVWVGDGTNWVQSFLPIVGWSTEGGSIAESPFGQIVTLEGGSHYGFGTYYRTPESNWTVVDPTIDDEGSARFTRQLGASDSHFYRLEYSHQFEPLLTRSDDGSSWTEVALPDVEFESLTFYVTADDRLTVYDPRWIVEEDATPTVYTSTDGGWTSVSYEGTRIMTVDDQRVITAADDQIFVYDVGGR